MFRGLHNNVSEIKSLENISIAYVEEAESVSEHSWNTLIPTVRAENSEIWVVFNPRDEKDATYQRFVVHPPENSRISFINYTDNPYCPAVMAEEAENCRRLDFDLYSHIWLGRCRKISEAAVFHGKFEMYEFDPPDEAKTRFYYGLDFGYSTDPNAFIRCFVEDNELFIDYEAGGTGIDLDEMPADARPRPGLPEMADPGRQRPPGDDRAFTPARIQYRRMCEVEGLRRGRNQLYPEFRADLHPPEMQTRLRGIPALFVQNRQKQRRNPADRRGCVQPLLRCIALCARTADPAPRGRRHRNDGFLLLIRRLTTIYFAKNQTQPERLKS